MQAFQPAVGLPSANSYMLESNKSYRKSLTLPDVVLRLSKCLEGVYCWYNCPETLFLSQICALLPLQLLGFLRGVSALVRSG